MAQKQIPIVPTYGAKTNSNRSYRNSNPIASFFTLWLITIPSNYSEFGHIWNSGSDVHDLGVINCHEIHGFHERLL